MPEIIVPPDEANAGNDLPGLNYPSYSARSTARSDTVALNNALSMHCTVTRSLEDGERIRILALNDGILSGQQNKSLTVMGDPATHYQVPTGYTAKLIMIVKGLDTNSNVRVRETAVADSTSGTIKYSTNNLLNTLDGGNHTLLTVAPEWEETEPTFSAGNFITVGTTSGNNNQAYSVINAFVIETPDPP